MPLISPWVSPVRGSSEGVSDTQRNTSAPTRPGSVYRNGRRNGRRPMVRRPPFGWSVSGGAGSAGTVARSTGRMLLPPAGGGHPLGAGGRESSPGGEYLDQP